MKRTAIGLLAGILLVIPGAALAKVPWSSVEFVPASPVAGEPLTVVVRFWDDAGHTQPSTWWPGSTHGASVEFHGAAGRIPVTLARTGDGVFHAEVVLAEGVWGLVAVQDFSGASGPSDVELATVTVAAAPSATTPIGATLVGVAVVVVGMLWRTRRSSSRGSAAQQG